MSQYVCINLNIVVSHACPGIDFLVLHFVHSSCWFAVLSNGERGKDKIILCVVRCIFSGVDGVTVQALSAG